MLSKAINKNYSMQYILVDIADREHFYPFTLTNSLASCRVGIFSFKERWEQYTNDTCGVYTAPYLQALYEDSEFLKNEEVLYFINVACIPSDKLMEAIKALNEGEKLMTAGGKWIATKTKERQISKILMAEKPPIVMEEVSFVLNQLQYFITMPNSLKETSSG